MGATVFVRVLKGFSSFLSGYRLDSLVGIYLLPDSTTFGSQHCATVYQPPAPLTLKGSLGEIQTECLF